MPTRFLAFALTVLAFLSPGCTTPGSDDQPLSPEATAVMSPIHKFVTGFNEGNAKAAIAVCTDEMSIIDEFAPFEWHGPAACSKWLADYDADAKRNGISDGVVTIEAPRHVDIAGGRAYVVIPASYTFLMRGTRMREEGSLFTFALQRMNDSWRICGWSWTKT